jgi:hypothetical protein
LAGGPQAQPSDPPQDDRTQRVTARLRAAAEASKPLVDPRNGRQIRTLGNESINKTLRLLAQILDEAEDATWIDRNPARSRRMRDPPERRRRSGALDLDEFRGSEGDLG